MNIVVANTIEQAQALKLRCKGSLRDGHLGEPERASLNFFLDNHLNK